MQEAFILKLIILALAVTFIAVIIALVLSFNVTQKLMKHNANLVGQVKESDKQQASTRQALYETEHELHEAEAQLKNGETVPELAVELALKGKKLIRILGKNSLVTDGYRTYFIEDGVFPEVIASQEGE